MIYLDCDIVVNLDIADLWDVPLETQKASLAAIKDLAFPNIFQDRYKKIRAWAMPYIPENYFNSGVLYMNLQKVRKKYNMLQDAFDFFSRYLYVADFADNDFLNVLFRNDVFYVDTRFNNIVEHHDIDSTIVHFAGSQPWKTPRNTPRDRLFWRILIESEWGDHFVERLIDMFQSKSLEHYHSLDCVNLLLWRIPRHLHLSNGAKELRIIFKELYWRLTRGNFVPSSPNEEVGLPCIYPMKRQR